MDHERAESNHRPADKPSAEFSAELARWNEAWEKLGMVSSDALSRLFGEILARYSEPHRKYHNEQHLRECFGRWDELKSFAQEPYEVELALWFHDAIYDVRGSGNEEKSADWARSIAITFGMDAESAERIHALILATRHSAEPCGKDQELLVDVDLSILGAKEERFDEYEQQVREEYAWVSEEVFRRERAKILEGFLARPVIFRAPLFQKYYEQKARVNIKRSIDRLRL